MKPSLVAAFVASILAPAAVAAPGSLLVYPYVEFGATPRCVISVTNTNTSEVVCGGRYRQGDVMVRLVFHDAAGCLEMDRLEALTPGDTFSARVDVLFPMGATRGWVHVEALDPETLSPIDFDYLIGSVNLADRAPNLKWWYQAYTFRSSKAERGAPNGTTTCGHALFDPATDATSDFDGVEYAAWPTTHQLDAFFGEGSLTPRGPLVGSRLILASPSAATTTVTMLLRNNNERVTSQLFQFDCLLYSGLSTLDPSADADELRIGYDSSELSGLPTGWFRLTADRPVLGLFLERVSRLDGTAQQSYGRPLDVSGSRTDVKIARHF